MTKKAVISPEDAALFRDAVAKVSRLSSRNRIPPAVHPPSPVPRFSQADEQEVLKQLLDLPAESSLLESGDELEYRHDGVQVSILRKLRRGQYARQAELDLHGMTAAQAKVEVVAFLKHCQMHSLRCVRIIHGKGLRSAGSGPVLKQKLANWLRQRQEVLAYCSARQVDGGTGAVYVLLRH